MRISLLPHCIEERHQGDKVGGVFKQNKSHHYCSYWQILFQFSLALVLIFTLSLFPQSALAEKGKPNRSPHFIIPEKLRPRVYFWLDIFTKYGKNQSVVHHREFPQAVFEVLDFSNEAAELGPIGLEKAKKQRIERSIARVRETLSYFNNGGRPRTEFEERVAEAMQMVPGRDPIGRVLSDPELIRSQTGIREKCGEALSRSGMYLKEIERIFVSDYGLPVELTRLPFIESSFDYRAYSSVGAAGIWQFMPATGKRFLTITKAIDERRDPISASYAAAQYLLSGYQALGSWPLAITGYNHGKAGVAKKVKEYGTSDISQLIERPFEKRPFGFASSNFYPEFLAALEVFDNPSLYFPEVKLQSPVEVRYLPITKPTTVGALSKRVGVSVERLKPVNLAILDATWQGRLSVPAGYRLKVPADPGVELVDHGEITAPEPEPVKVREVISIASAYHRVKKGETLSSIAAKYGKSIAQLKELNSLTSDKLRLGQQLVVAVGKSERKTADVSTTKSYVVKKGDTLHKIARQFGVTVASIRSANKLTSSNLKVGQKLKIAK